VLVVYIASQYELGDKSENVLRQIEIAHTLMDYGFSFYAPLLMHYVEAFRSRPTDEYMSIDLEFVSRCDAVLRLEGRSVGADIEEAYARELGIPVVYSIAELQALEGR